MIIKQTTNYDTYEQWLRLYTNREKYKILNLSHTTIGWFFPTTWYYLKVESLPKPKGRLEFRIGPVSSRI